MTLTTTAPDSLETEYISVFAPVRKDSDIVLSLAEQRYLIRLAAIELDVVTEGRNIIIPALLDTPTKGEFYFEDGDPFIEFQELYAAAGKNGLTALRVLAIIQQFRRQIRDDRDRPTGLTLADVSDRAFAVGSRDLFQEFINLKIYIKENRILQTLGYAKESILLTALEGVTVSAPKSPVISTISKKGRQIDCLLGSYAIEIKSKLRSMPSGGGRLQKDEAFPSEAETAGFIPVLLIPSIAGEKPFKKLRAKYEAAGGLALDGGAAWDFVFAHVQPEVKVIVDKYFRKPEVAAPVEYMDHVREDLGIQVSL